MRWCSITSASAAYSSVARTTATSFAGVKRTPPAARVLALIRDQVDVPEDIAAKIAAALRG
jgi:hypothetical protein